MVKKSGEVEEEVKSEGRVKGKKWRMEEIDEMEVPLCIVSN